ncbi:MAG: AAA family ATPase, partial [Syntrophales bacterium]
MEYRFEIMDIDRQFGRLMGNLCDGRMPVIERIAAVLCAATREGHICMDLRSIAGQKVIFEEGAPEEIIPDQAILKQCLMASPVVGPPGEFKPLIFDQAHRLYLYRYWNYEQDLACAFRSRINRPFLFDRHAGEDEAGKILFLLEGLFGKNGGDIHWQKIAAAMCCLRTLCVLTGSPGTGKTTTVGSILALLLGVSPLTLRIALTAPTGKAAARLGEAIAKAKRSLSCPDMIKDAIPEKASTIHRLLESRPYSPYFKYNESHQLPVDILVVDEASMVDMPLMAKLVRALPDTSRLILVGDRNQLASVEAGAVLGDLCGNFITPHFTAEFVEMLSKVTGSELPSIPVVSPQAGVRDCMVELRKNYRFPEGKSIGRFSAAVQRGDHQEMTDVLKGSLQNDFQWMALPDPGSLRTALRDMIVQEYGLYFAA